MSISRCKETKMLKIVKFLVDTLSADSREEGGRERVEWAKRVEWGKRGGGRKGREQLPHARRASSCIIISQ